MDRPKLSIYSNYSSNNSGNESSNPSNSEFEIVSAFSLNISNMESSSTSSHSSSNRATNGTTSQSNSISNTTLPQILQPGSEQNNELQQGGNMQNEMLAKENELLKKGLDETKRILALKEEERQRLERELDKSRSVMANIIACQIGAKKKEKEEMEKRATSATKKCPPTRQTPPTTHSIWDEPEQTCSSAMIREDRMNLQQQQAHENEHLSQSHQNNEENNQSANHMSGFELLRRLLKFGQNDIIVYARRCERYEAINYLITKEAINHIIRVMPATNFDEWSVILVPNEATGLDYMEMLRLKDVYYSKGNFLPQTFLSHRQSKFYVLTCFNFIQQLAIGSLKLEHMRFLLLDSAKELVADSDFARCILEIQSRANRPNYRIMALTSQLDSSLMAILRNILHHLSIVRIENSSSSDEKNVARNGREETMINVIREFGASADEMGSQAVQIPGDRNNSDITQSGSPVSAEGCIIEVDVDDHQLANNDHSMPDGHASIWVETPSVNGAENGAADATDNDLINLTGNESQEERVEMGCIAAETGSSNNSLVQPPSISEISPEIALDFLASLNDGGHTEQQPHSHRTGQQQEDEVNTSYDLYESALESLTSRSRSATPSSISTSSTGSEEGSDPSQDHPIGRFSPSNSSGNSLLLEQTVNNTRRNIQWRNAGNSTNMNSLQVEGSMLDGGGADEEIDDVGGTSSNGHSSSGGRRNVATIAETARRIDQMRTQLDGLLDGHDELRESTYRVRSRLDAHIDDVDGRLRRLEALNHHETRNDNFIVDLDMRLDQLEERMASIPHHQAADPNPTNDRAQQNADMNERIGCIEQRIERIERGELMKKALLMEYARGFGQRNSNGELHLTTPFANNEQFKQLYFVGACFGYRGIIVNRSAHFECSEQFLDQIIQHVLQTHSIDEMMQFLVLNFPTGNKPQWPSSLLNVDHPAFDGSSGNIKKRAVHMDKVIYSLRNVHSPRAKFVIELYYGPLDQLYQKASTFSIRRLVPRV